MASITLPSAPGYARAAISPIDYGGIVTPPLGGAQQRINRIGNRFALQADLPIMTPDDAAAWIVALELAQQSGAIARAPQVEFDVGHPGAALVAGAGQIGSTINIDGLTPGYPLRAAQLINLTVSGRAYLYRVAVAVRANVGGVAAVQLTTMIRKSPADNSVVTIINPVIEGFLTAELAWDYDRARRIPVSFSIAEAG